MYSSNSLPCTRFRHPNCWFYDSGTTGCAPYGAGLSDSFANPVTTVNGAQIYNIGNGRRNSLYAPNTDVFDAALMKNFPIAESLTAQLLPEIVRIGEWAPDTLAGPLF